MTNISTVVGITLTSIYYQHQNHNIMTCFTGLQLSSFTIRRANMTVREILALSCTVLFLLRVRKSQINVYQFLEKCVYWSMEVHRTCSILCSAPLCTVATDSEFSDLTLYKVWKFKYKTYCKNIKNNLYDNRLNDLECIVIKIMSINTLKLSFLPN